ncbi:MAG: hypothetical protein WC124_12190 [Desulfoplanes sp.]|jgi:hypothetical protein
MANLKDKYIHETYHSVLSIGIDGTNGVSSSLQNITDGNGTATPISLSTSLACITNLSLSSISNYTNDASAALGGVPINGIYHTDGILKIRLA